MIDTPLPSTCVARELDAIIAVRGKALIVASDNATRPTSPTILHRAQDWRIERYFITPRASRGRTASSKASMVAYANEWLNQTLFVSLGHARSVLPAWRENYDHVGPHAGIGEFTPDGAATQIARPHLPEHHGNPRPY